MAPALPFAPRHGGQGGHAPLDSPTVDEPVTGKGFRFEHYQVALDADGKPWKLGEGAMGVTYLAEDTNLKVKVALKVIRPTLLGDAEVGQRFQREAQAAARLRHPNVAGVYHLGAVDNTCFYAMEFVEGETVKDRIQRDGPLPVKDALEIALQVCEALGAAEKHRMVHRDIKPANIMLEPAEDEMVRAKLIDFGLAKPLQAEAQSSLQTQAGIFLGTPVFASPEQVEDAPLDTRSDFYAVGLTLWFMLEGRTPFEGSLHKVLFDQVHTAPPLSRLLWIPGEVRDLLSKLLEKDPAKRPQTARELRQKIHDCLRSLANAGTSYSEWQQRFQVETPPRSQPWGMIFEGQDTLSGAVQLHLLRNDRFSDSKAIQGVLADARRAIDLHHPNILRHLTVFPTSGSQSGGTGWMVVTEHPGTETLLDYLRKMKQIPAAETLSLIECLAAAVDICIANDLIAADLDPAAVYLKQIPISEIRPLEPKPGRSRRKEFYEVAPKISPINYSYLSTLRQAGETVIGMTQANFQGQPTTPEELVQRLALLAYQCMGGSVSGSWARVPRFIPLAVLTQRQNDALRHAINAAPWARAADLVQSLQDSHAPARKPSGSASAPNLETVPESSSAQPTVMLSSWRLLAGLAATDTADFLPAEGSQFITGPIAKKESIPQPPAPPLEAPLVEDAEPEVAPAPADEVVPGTDAVSADTGMPASTASVADASPQDTQAELPQEWEEAASSEVSSTFGETPDAGPSPTMDPGGAAEISTTAFAEASATPGERVEAPSETAGSELPAASREVMPSLDAPPSTDILPPAAEPVPLLDSPASSSSIRALLGLPLLQEPAATSAAEALEEPGLDEPTPAEPAIGPTVGATATESPAESSGASHVAEAPQPTESTHQATQSHATHGTHGTVSSTLAQRVQVISRREYINPESTASLNVEPPPAPAVAENRAASDLPPQVSPGQPSVTHASAGSSQASRRLQPPPVTGTHGSASASGALARPPAPPSIQASPSQVRNESAPREARLTDRLPAWLLPVAAAVLLLLGIAGVMRLFGGGQDTPVPPSDRRIEEKKKPDDPPVMPPVEPPPPAPSLSDLLNGAGDAIASGDTTKFAALWDALLIKHPGDEWKSSGAAPGLRAKFVQAYTEKKFEDGPVTARRYHDILLSHLQSDHPDMPFLVQVCGDLASPQDSKTAQPFEEAWLFRLSDEADWNEKNMETLLTLEQRRRPGEISNRARTVLSRSLSHIVDFLEMNPREQQENDTMQSHLVAVRPKLRRCVDANVPEASFILGCDALDAGNLEAADAHFKTAADQGNVPAMRRHGLLLTNPIGSRPPDWNDAVRWLKLAVERDDNKARAVLAETYMRRAVVTGTAPDYEAVHGLLIDAASREMPRAWYLLGFYLIKVRQPEPFVPSLQGAERLRKAEEYLRKAVEKGEPDAHFFLAGLLREMSRFKEAVDVLTAGSKLNPPDPYSLYFLSTIYWPRSDRGATSIEVFMEPAQIKSAGVEPDAELSKKLYNEAVKILRAMIKKGELEAAEFCRRYQIIY